MWKGHAARRIALAIATVLLGLSLTACGRTGEPGSPPLRIGAAASLRHVLPSIAEDLSMASGIDAEFTFAASGTIATQAIAGAPMDAVVVAGREPLRRLLEAGRVEPGTEVRVAGNSLVLVLRPEVAVAGGGDGLAALAGLPWDLPVAIADPRTAPLGDYSRAALVARGLYDALLPRMVFAPHAAAVIAWVERGDAGAGIVYRTDALAAPGLTAIPIDSADLGIAVLAAPLRGSSPDTAEWLDGLRRDAARRRLAEAGFE